MWGCENQEIKPARGHTQAHISVSRSNGPVGQNSLFMFRQNLSYNDRNKCKYSDSNLFQCAYVEMCVQCVYVSFPFAYTAQTHEHTQAQEKVSFKGLFSLYTTHIWLTVWNQPNVVANCSPIFRLSLDLAHVQQIVSLCFVCVRSMCVHCIEPTKTDNSEFWDIKWLNGIVQCNVVDEMTSQLIYSCLVLYFVSRSESRLILSAETINANS